MLGFSVLSDEQIDQENEAANGREAIYLLAKEAFDCILMDCQMPVMDGYEVTSQIRKQEYHRNLPIIAMTANALKGDREKVLAVGMNDDIPYPIKPQMTKIKASAKRSSRWLS